MLYRYRRKKEDLRRMRRKQKRCGRKRENMRRSGRRAENSEYVTCTNSKKKNHVSVLYEY
jgi:hypothetical protein